MLIAESKQVSVVSPSFSRMSSEILLTTKFKRQQVRQGIFDPDTSTISHRSRLCIIHSIIALASTLSSSPLPLPPPLPFVFTVAFAFAFATTFTIRHSLSLSPLVVVLMPACVVPLPTLRFRLNHDLCPSFSSLLAFFITFSSAIEESLASYLRWHSYPQSLWDLVLTLNIILNSLM